MKDRVQRDELMKSHDKTCPESPAVKMKKRIEELEKDLSRSKRWNDEKSSYITMFQFNSVRDQNIPTHLPVLQFFSLQIADVVV